MKTAILFPGQGSQFAGMGKDLFDRFPDETAQAGAICGYDIRELCLRGGDRLDRTEFTQPALFTVNHLSWLARGGTPSFFAGHSLGEFNALCAAGAFDFATGLRLVAERGRLMSRVTGGGMAAVIGLNPWQLRRAVAGAGLKDLDVANFNSYEQVVVSGPVASIEPAVSALKAAGARHVVPLRVSAPFHSRYMQGPREEFAPQLEAAGFKEPVTPVVANATALPYSASVAPTLARQLSSPVRWIETIEYLMRRGVTAFEEVGPGQVLTKLVAQIQAQSAFAVGGARG